MKIITIIGARPQFIKASVISRIIREKYTGIEEVILHTGQHFDDNMSDDFFSELGIPTPSYNLDVNRLSHGSMTGKMLEIIEKVLICEKPDRVLVYGDTNSTLAGALAAVKLHIPVAHVEAGMRCFDKKVPEEVNRVLTDHISNFLFCAVPSSIKNLEKEGIKEHVYFTGDVMYDLFLRYKNQYKKSDIFNKLQLKQDYFYATFHRRENTTDLKKLTNILNLLNEISKEFPIIFPVHPGTKKIINADIVYSNIFLTSNIWNTAPLSYSESIDLISNSKGVLTDSGGVQKEAYWSKVPCVTIREATEWKETVESGWNYLVHPNKLYKFNAIDFFQKFNRKKIQHQIFGDGNAGEIIVKNLIKFGEQI